MLTLTSPHKTRLHGLPAGAKLLALAGLTIALFQMGAVAPLGIVALGLCALHLAVGGPGFAAHAARMLWPVWPFVAVVGLWHLWLGDGSGGAVIVLRMVSAIAAANLVTMTTRLADMIAVIEVLARPIGRVLPPRRLALGIALVIRFVPVLAERTGHLANAYRARSAAKRPGWRIFAPAALAALDDAEHVAEALRARGGAE
jgi:biotin transport system permease protein